MKICCSSSVASGGFEESPRDPQSSVRASAEPSPCGCFENATVAPTGNERGRTGQPKWHSSSPSRRGSALIPPNQFRQHHSPPLIRWPGRRSEETSNDLVAESSRPPNPIILTPPFAPRSAAAHPSSPFGGTTISTSDWRRLPSPRWPVSCDPVVVSTLSTWERGGASVWPPR